MGKNYKLQAARNKKRWSQAEAAERVGVELQTFHRWETGKQRIRLSSLDMLCRAFDASPEDLGFSAEQIERIEQDALPSQALPEAEGTLQKGVALTESRLSELQERSMSFGELQERVEHILRRFLDMERLSRRTLIALLTSVPAAAFAVAPPGEAPLLRDDEVLSLAAANIPLIWRLYFAGGLTEVRETLPIYLKKLSTLAGQLSRYQQRASHHKPIN